MCATWNVVIASGGTTSGVHRFSKKYKGLASTNYRRQNCDINKFLTEDSQVVGSSVQKSVTARLYSARDLCTLALSKVVGPLKIFIVNAENFIWSGRNGVTQLVLFVLLTL